MKNISSREMIRLIESEGWFLVEIVGSHHQFKHQTQIGKVTIPHPRKELAPKTIKSILKEAQFI